MLPDKEKCRNQKPILRTLRCIRSFWPLLSAYRTKKIEIWLTRKEIRYNLKNIRLEDPKISRSIAKLFQWSSLYDVHAMTTQIIKLTVLQILKLNNNFLRWNILTLLWNKTWNISYIERGTKNPNFVEARLILCFQDIIKIQNVVLNKIIQWRRHCIIFIFHWWDTSISLFGLYKLLQWSLYYRCLHLHSGHLIRISLPFKP